MLMSRLFLWLLVCYGVGGDRAYSTIDASAAGTELSMEAAGDEMAAVAMSAHQGQVHAEVVQLAFVKNHLKKMSQDDRMLSGEPIKWTEWALADKKGDPEPPDADRPYFYVRNADGFRQAEPPRGDPGSVSISFVDGRDKAHREEFREMIKCCLCNHDQRARTFKVAWTLRTPDNNCADACDRKYEMSKSSDVYWFASWYYASSDETKDMQTEESCEEQFESFWDAVEYEDLEQADVKIYLNGWRENSHKSSGQHGKAEMKDVGAPDPHVEKQQQQQPPHRLALMYDSMTAAYEFVGQQQQEQQQPPQQSQQSKEQ
eukprot:gnl/TRDRNA2_/TRDRNA2_57174_c0_seq1.p1 gnl/TRDRNA2_/TRDRNA2_57174_c0~~gnl/TRDRNA2_/TRDRNA2_57174_c0_seq1.p1  ORF type:complete len:316 (-),score=83.53 gnl/TRDRNA2_/TRDRNA2_57174_c0_seq1:212-1159(-)